jgi:AraC family transcriptional regulator
MASDPQGDFHGKTLTSREVAGFVLREMVHKPGVSIPKHFHKCAHVAFVLRGAFTERCERRTLECRPLSVSFLAPGITHSDDFGNEVHCLLVDIAPHRLEHLRDALPLDDPIFLNGGVSAWLMMRLYNEARQTDEASSLAVEGLALEILAELSRQRTPVSQPKSPRWLEQARELIQAQFPETLTHDAMANAVGVHPVHLANVFRQHYKCTIGEYVRRLRIEHACRELSASDASLVEIALASGFSDQSHFSKVFKRLAGMTPTQFRTNLRKP